MSQVIGRVTTGTYETVRGPDVTHRITVARAWLIAGELVEFELPRNLTCASCEGGGCDRCKRQGAITLRPRGVAAETVQLTLPKRTEEELREQPSFVLRVPGHGGKERVDRGETRGLLLLRIVVGDRSDPGVRRIESTSVAEVEPPMDAPRPTASGRGGIRKGHWVVILGLAVLAVLGWIVIRMVSNASLP
ncbi:MAG TPA: hypothetical protein VIM73_19105 [Polyangiaceae bacterium]